MNGLTDLYFRRDSAKGSRSLREVAGIHGFTVTVMSRDGIQGKRFEEDLPRGFFSFLPPSPDLILELANLLLGSENAFLCFKG